VVAAANHLSLRRSGIPIAAIGRSGDIGHRYSAIRPDARTIHPLPGWWIWRHPFREWAIAHRSIGSRFFTRRPAGHHSVSRHPFGRCVGGDGTLARRLPACGLSIFRVDVFESTIQATGGTIAGGWLSTGGGIGEWYRDAGRLLTVPRSSRRL